MTPRPPLRDDLAAFARLTGWGYYPIAFIGRLPFAMMIVGVLTLVATARGSVAEAGLAAAAAGIGTAALGPAMGALADRFGQRVVLIASSLVSIASVAALLWLVVGVAAPLLAIVPLAFLTGGTTPQVAPFSRSRLAVFAGTPRTEATRSRAMSMVMSYESMMDEASFVLGPVIVGVLTSLIAVWAPLVAGALITATVVTAFALHPTGSRPARSVARAHPSGRAFTPEIAVLALGMLLVGSVFGFILTALTRFMSDRGAGEQTGIVYGAMSAGAILVAVLVAALPARFGLAARWTVFGVVGVLGAVAMAASSTVPLMAVALFLSGCGIGAVLVALFSLGARAAPEGRSTTVLTTLQSTLVVGQALATALGGVVAEAFGATTGFLLVVGATIALVVLARLYAWGFGAQRG